MLQWEKPKSDGNAEITHYVVEMQTNDSNEWIHATFVQNESKESAVITGLQEGKTYIFRTAAVNKVGMGPFGNSSTPMLAKSPYGRLWLLLCTLTLPGICKPMSHDLFYLTLRAYM